MTNGKEYSFIQEIIGIEINISIIALKY